MVLYYRFFIYSGKKTHLVYSLAHPNKEISIQKIYNTYSKKKKLFKRKNFSCLFERTYHLANPKKYITIQKICYAYPQENQFFKQKNFNTHLRERFFYLKKKNYYACLEKWSPKQRNSHTCLKNAFLILSRKI